MGRYLQLLSQNTLLFNLDYVKTILNEAYKLDSEEKMTIYIDEIISYCNCTENCHFKWLLTCWKIIKKELLAMQNTAFPMEKLKV